MHRRLFQKVTAGLGVIVLLCLMVRLELTGQPTAEARQPSILLPAAIGATAPPVLKLSSDFPHVVPTPPGGLTPGQQQPWFDTFSFQEFIALNWPAVPGQRGVPKNPNDQAAFKAAFIPNPSGNYPQVVWGSWKQAYELFEQGSVRPSAWSSFSAVLPCVNPGTTAPKTFLDATPNDINESFQSPLIDQSRNYARYEIRINEPEYNLIRGDDSQPTSWLYIAQNLAQATPLTFPISTSTTFGAVEVKAAWKPMTARDDPMRYYVVNALVLVDPVTKRAQYQKMGLVGFHIAHKTAPFSEWVWSTFEQVDNVQAPPGITPSYNSGSGPPQPNGFDYEPPKFQNTFDPSPKPVQVSRVNPILTTPPSFSTTDLNASFQALVDGTVWKNYQLISTQWPTKPAQFKLPGSSPPANGKYPGDCGLPFPSDRVANTVIETYQQGPTTSPNGNSCMSCHYVTARTDFSWVLQLRSHKAISPSQQGTFLATGRFAKDRALEAFSGMGPSDAEHATPLLRAVESLNLEKVHAK